MEACTIFTWRNAFDCSENAPSPKPEHEESALLLGVTVAKFGEQLPLLGVARKAAQLYAQLTFDGEVDVDLDAFAQEGMKNNDQSRSNDYKSGDGVLPASVSRSCSLFTLFPPLPLVLCQPSLTIASTPSLEWRHVCVCVCVRRIKRSCCVLASLRMKVLF